MRWKRQYLNSPKTAKQRVTSTRRQSRFGRSRRKSVGAFRRQIGKRSRRMDQLISIIICTDIRRSGENSFC